MAQVLRLHFDPGAPVITAYHRPKTLQEALALLNRPSIATVPLGGGTLLSNGGRDAIEVVDLQALGLNQIVAQGNDLALGATATLQSLLENPHCPAGMQIPLKLEAPLNVRNAATVAGTVVACGGRSTFVTALLALDARLVLIGRGPRGKSPRKQETSVKEETENLGDFLPLRAGGLITRAAIPLRARLGFEYVARTPSDKPIVCVAIAQWPSGRTRVAVGGWGQAPLLAMDGTEAGGIETAVRNAFHEANDEWGSAAYRMDAAATLAARCLAGLAP